MYLKYDPDANAAYIYLKDRIDASEVARSEMCDVEIAETAVILQFDAADKLIGIEILGSRKLLHEEVLAAAR